MESYCKAENKYNHVEGEEVKGCHLNSTFT